MRSYCQSCSLWTAVTDLNGGHCQVLDTEERFRCYGARPKAKMQRSVKAHFILSHRSRNVSSRSS